MFIRVLFTDGLCLQYGLTPNRLPKDCDGCSAPFSLHHGLNCKKGGLILHRHNELRDEVATLAAAAFAPSAIRTEPMIIPGHFHPLPPSSTTNTNSLSQLLMSNPSSNTLFSFAGTYLFEALCIKPQTQFLTSK